MSHFKLEASDHEEATAAVLLALQDAESTPVSRSAAIEAQRTRIDSLLSPNSREALQAIGSHCLITEVLARRFALASASASTVDAKTKFAKLSLQAMSTHARLLAALEGVKAIQSKGARIVSISDDDDDSADDLGID